MPARGLVLSVVLAGIGVAASPGIRPRGIVSDYPAHESTAAFEVGAVRIPPADVKKMFAADLSRAGYVVIEVGVYPVQGAEVDLAPDAFTLHTESGRIAARVVDPDAMAAEIARERVPSAPRVSDVFRTSGASTGRGRLIGPPDGNADRPSVFGGDVEDYPQVSTVSKLAAVEQELWAKSLPDGKTKVPVAGYLYFPKPSGKASGDWELLLDAGQGRLKLTLQDAGKH
jgi:hypothetical protein